MRFARIFIATWVAALPCANGAEASPAPTPTRTLTVYAYDSFAGKNSLGAFVAERLKARGTTTRFVTFGSAGEALNQILLEGKNTAADILVGVDNTMLARAKASGAFVKEEKRLAEGLDKSLLFDPDGIFLPFDYGYLAFIEDARRAPKLPSALSLKRLAAIQELKHRIVIEDPRTSSLGLTFLAWTHTFTDSESDSFWRSFSKQLVTISPGWSGAYGLFLKKEADLVLSYSTSPAYHREKEHDGNYRALIFPEGNFRQIEGAALVGASKQKAAAREWLSYLFSKEAQAEVPLTQWMYPARSDVGLPASFRELPVPKPIALPPETIERCRAVWLKRWVELVGR